MTLMDQLEDLKNTALNFMLVDAMVKDRIDKIALEETLKAYGIREPASIPEQQARAIFSDFERRREELREAHRQQKLLDGVRAAEQRARLEAERQAKWDDAAAPFREARRLKQLQKLEAAKARGEKTA